MLWEHNENSNSFWGRWNEWMYPWKMKGVNVWAVSRKMRWFPKENLVVKKVVSGREISMSNDTELYKNMGSSGKML